MFFEFHQRLDLPHPPPVWPGFLGLAFGVHGLPQFVW